MNSGFVKVVKYTVIKFKVIHYNSIQIYAHKIRINKYDGCGALS